MYQEKSTGNHRNSTYYSFLVLFLLLLIFLQMLLVPLLVTVFALTTYRGWRTTAAGWSLFFASTPLAFLV